MITALAIIALLIVTVGIVAAVQPDSFRLQREATINAPAEKIFPLINDLHLWIDWSPWEKIDPELKRTYAGAASGKGAVYEWQGNSKVGQGRMEIIESIPASRIVIKLDFLKPFEAHNTAEFTLQGSGSGNGHSTHITWAMFGPSPYLSKVMCLFISMDRMVGKDFERGLAQLKRLAEL